ncbi:hypothetical protein ADL06_02150 [Streptomyces sp. NRRL F-6491]|nr:hypothetical protein ADL06_02150 [Streptomyces sp. NRRL F-6491]KOX52385.1 hypothetical protein ADL08_02050 [Streptomyces sp. NRRL F-6492]
MPFHNMGETTVLDSDDAHEAMTILIRAASTGGGVVMRTNFADETSQVRGWKLTEFYAQPLSAVEISNAYCTDAETGGADRAGAGCAMRGRPPPEGLIGNSGVGRGRPTPERHRPRHAARTTAGPDGVTPPGPADTGRRRARPYRTPAVVSEAGSTHHPRPW